MDTQISAQEVYLHIQIFIYAVVGLINIFIGWYHNSNLSHTRTWMRVVIPMFFLVAIRLISCEYEMNSSDRINDPGIYGGRVIFQDALGVPVVFFILSGIADRAQFPHGRVVDAEHFQTLHWIGGICLPWIIFGGTYILDPRPEWPEASRRNLFQALFVYGILHLLLYGLAIAIMDRMYRTAAKRLYERKIITAFRVMMYIATVRIAYAIAVTYSALEEDSWFNPAAGSGVAAHLRFVFAAVPELTIAVWWVIIALKSPRHGFEEMKRVYDWLAHSTDYIRDPQEFLVRQQIAAKDWIALPIVYRAQPFVGSFDPDLAEGETGRFGQLFISLRY